MIYLILGEQTAQKDEKIREIRRQLFSDQEDRAVLFDFESLSAHKLDSDELKKSLITLPVVVAKRLVVVRDAHKLSDTCKNIILEFSDVKQDNAVLILDFAENTVKGTFGTKLKKVSKTFDFHSFPKRNVFDMTKIMARNPAEALKILNELYGQGEHPLKIMGGLVWFWGKEKGRLKAERYNKGLLFLQEADLNIKRSRLNAEQAMEVLVVKLCSLLALRQQH